MRDMTDTERAAFKAGADDYWGNGPANPYPPNSAEHAAYEAGWDSQDDVLGTATEGSVSKRKNLNDVLGNDRAVVRANRYEKAWSDDGVLDFDQKKQKGSKSSTFFSATHKCYRSHPALTLPGTGLVIHGGSCSDPVVTDADVYIGFDGSMRWTERHYPWKKGDEVFFRIPDMSVPPKPEEFVKLIHWTRKQLEDGRKVHCGCIGGHGRTGTFLAALCSTYGEEDAITYVRSNYCAKAVESAEQIRFLEKNFGIKPVKGSKAGQSSGKHPDNRKSAGPKIYGYLKGAGSIWD